MRHLSAMLLLALLVSSTHARDIFVDNIGGDDRFCGYEPIATTNINGPVRTITKALRLTLPGDRIVVANTGLHYHECISIRGEYYQSGYFGKPLTLEGNGAILDGSEPIPADGWEFVAGDVFRFQPARMAFQQLFLDGKPVMRIIASPAGPRPELQPLEWCLYQGWIYFRGEAGKIPQQYPLNYTALQTGITLYKAHDILIHNLTVQGFELDGINAHDGARNVRLVNVTCRGNGRAGVCAAGGSRVELAGCTLGDNGAAQLLLEGFSLTRVYHSLLIPNTAPEIVRGADTRLYLDGELMTAKDEEALER